MLINYIGGSTRFLYGYIIRKLRLTNRKYYRFHEYINGPDDAEDFVLDVMGHAFVNRLVGLIVIVFFGFSILYFS